MLFLRKRPIIILCFITIRYCRNHDFSSIYNKECIFWFILLDLYLDLPFWTRNNVSFSKIWRFVVCTKYFCKHIMCIGFKIFIFEEEFIPYLNEPLWTYDTSFVDDMIHQVTRPTIVMIQTGLVIYTYIVDHKLSKKNRILIIFANMW